MHIKQSISDLMHRRYVDQTLVLPEYNASADFEWIRSHSQLPWLELAISVPVDIILSEIKNIESLCVDHREDYNEHAGWSSFCIHGKAYDATREHSHYADSRPYVWTAEAQELMPETVNYFKNVWPSSGYQRLRVMRLAPGGYVTIHKDTSVSSLWPINIAITQPDNCDFVMARHGRVPFQPGSAMLLDISNNHVVCNHSDQTRWHLIVHQSFDNTDFHKLVVNSYQLLYNKHNDTMPNYYPG